MSAVTKRDAYPIPRMNAWIDSLCDAAFFTPSDTNREYWQIELEELDLGKTAFLSHYGLYRFICMLFGLKNASETFQRILDVIARTVRWQFALVYLNDVVTFTEAPEDNMRHIKKVLKHLKNSDLTLNRKKSLFLTETIGYLEHVACWRSLKFAPYTTDAMSGIQEPTNITELKSFLNIFNEFRNFVRNFVRLAVPLKIRLREGKPTKFVTLNEEELTAPILWKKKFYLHWYQPYPIRPSTWHVTQIHATNKSCASCYRCNGTGKDGPLETGPGHSMMRKNNDTTQR